MTRGGASTLAALRAGDLAGAVRLDLSGAELTALPPEVFGLADTLEILDLGRNPLSALPPDFGRLGCLKILFCSGAPFSVLPPVLGDCRALTQIGFRGCGIRTVPAEALPPGLRWLTLTDNEIATLPASLGERPALRKLMLTGNRLADLPASLAGAGSLELLRLAANRFERVPAFLGELPRLAWLALGANPAEGALPAPLAGPLVPMAALTIGALLGEGASGRVHAATWNGRTVALKRFRGAVTSDGLPAHEMAAALAACGHANVLGALARVAGDADGDAAMLMPLIPGGWRGLAGPPSFRTCSRDVYDPELRLDGGVALRIARDVAAAGAHLASRGVLHGDLYAHNIHWDGRAGTALLGDFGAATYLSRLEGGAALRATDVLAWGILASELGERTGDEPARAELGALAEFASSPEPRWRPGFAELLDALKDGQGALPLHPAKGRGP